MKKKIQNTLLILCSVCLMTACSKDTDSKLFGKWQLQQVEMDGVVEKVDTIYFNFQSSLFMYQVYRPQTESFSYRYGYNTLEGENILYLELTNDPGPVSTFLPYTDWTSAKRTYTIDKISGKELILNSENKTYVFRKF